ncbi:MAG TPA: oligosaccharide flippase family protein [Anaerolineaceae bacterium]|nr:oligosaccharide flippase family protein [Anaerolineaceae bacterium]HPN52532.1 oligosaccharide flippase family protein [Anaerolineaceae bacterium]
MAEGKTYRIALQTTAIFGGVQVFQILLSILRGKLVAVLLGSAGVGISTQYISSLVIISAIATLGLNLSGIRNIAQACEENDREKLSRTYTIFVYSSYATAALGVILTVICAPLLSISAFQTPDYTLSFIALSVHVAFTILWGNQNTILQGTKSYKELAISNLLGTLLSLLLIIPLYYFWGQEGIVPGLVGSSFVNFAVAHYCVRRLNIPIVQTSVREIIESGMEMAKLGIAMMLTSLIGNLVIFLINTYITINGSLSELGLYQSGSNITTQYVGLIFSAMVVGYFPQLSAASKDNLNIRKIANEQSEITLLLISPILNFLILLAPVVIQILLSPEFLPVVTFIRIMCLGTILKAASYPIGYISFAKGDKKTFFLLEGIGGNLQNLIASIIGYSLGGLNGIAIAYFCNYFVYFIILSIVTYKLYGYSTNKAIIKFIMIAMTSAIILIFSLIFFVHPVTYLLMFLVCAGSCIYSYIELQQRVHISPQKIIKRAVKIFRP